MRTLALLAVAGVLVAAGPGSAQEVKDLAELFPAKTKAYLEINSIAEVVKELRALFKGSCIEDLPGSMDKIRAKMGDDYYHSYFGGGMWLMTFLQPEGIAELSRLRGGAVALTEMPKDRSREPGVVGILLTGESNIPAMIVRGVAAAPYMRALAQVEGVKIYGHRYPIFDNKGGQAKFREEGPALALLPGAIVIGSTTADVSDLVRRFKGKGEGPSLASVAEFKKAAELRQASLFLYAEPESLVNLVTLLGPKKKKKFDFDKKFDVFKDDKKPGAPVAIQEKPADSPGANLLASLKAFRTVAAGLTLKNGTLDVRGAVTLDAKTASAWPDFFTARTVNLNLLHFAPRDGRSAMLLPLPAGDRFWDKLGKTAPVFETWLSLNLGAGALEKITHLALVDAPGKEGKIPGPVWLLETKDAEAARALAKDLTANLKLAAQAKDRFVAAGMDRAVLGRLLDLGTAQKGWLADAKVAKALKDHGGAHALLVWSMGQIFVDEINAGAARAKGVRRPDFDPEKKFEKCFEEVAVPRNPPQKGPGPNGPDRFAKEMDRLVTAMVKAIEPLPPFVLSLTKKDDQLILRGRQTHLQPSVARLVDVLVEWDIVTSMGPRFRHFREDGPPPPPKPPLDKE